MVSHDHVGGHIATIRVILTASIYFYATNTFSSFCLHIYNCVLNNCITGVYHVWLTVVLIVAADRKSSIAVLCGLSGVNRLRATHCDVLQGLGASSASV